MVGGVRVGVGAGRLAGRRGDQRRRPAARDGRPRRAAARSSARPSCGTTPSRPPDAACADRPAAGRPARRGPRRAGSVPVASFTITKLAWLRRSEPEALARLAHVVLPHDWLTFRLTGSLDHRPRRRLRAPATGRRRSGTYRDDLLALVDADRDWSAARARRCSVRGDIAGEWHGATVGPGTGDNMAGALGVGLRSRGRGGVDRDVGHGVLGVRLADAPIRRASSPGSPTPPAGTCRWSARSTPPR